MKCYDCPRMCGIDREKARGFCGENDKIKVAKIIPNFMWEEPCISGEKGCLAIFFSGCNLRCSFCQNYEISHASKGREFTPKEFASLIKSYDLSKFSCVDLITPTHFSSMIIEGLQGEKFPIPIVWNSSGYEREEIIEKLCDVVDVFLPDLKYYSPELSLKLSGAEDYFAVAIKGIMKMREKMPTNIFDEKGVLTRGVLIRHLVLPTHVRDSFRVLDKIKEGVKNPFISLMSQFTPRNEGELDRRIFPLEYKSVLAHAEKLRLTEGYMQAPDSADEDFIPKF